MPRATNAGNSMGLGDLGLPDVIFKRKYRWTFEVQGLATGPVPKHYVKLAARPTLTIDETEINFLHGKDYIPGKGTWETISVTYYDVITGDSKAKPLWDWIATVYNITDPEGLHQASVRRYYSGTGVLKLYDGCGKELERWFLYDIWPQQINFGELDYSSSEEVTIEMTMRFNVAEYVPVCAPQLNPACAGCGQGGAFLSTTYEFNVPLIPPNTMPPLGPGLTGSFGSSGFSNF